MSLIFNISDFKNRRESLLQKMSERFANKNGKILLFADFEINSLKFKQESSFYYFTGVNEPGAVLMLGLDGYTTLFVPNNPSRAHWVSLSLNQNHAKDFGFDKITYLGDQTKTFEFQPFFSKGEYKNLLSEIDNIFNKNELIFSLNPNNQYQYFQQRFIYNQINNYVPKFSHNLVDISPIVAQLRRTKSKKEIEALYKAIDITIIGHESIMEILSSAETENELQAVAEYAFINMGADLAFASIIGSGKNSTILHYTENKQKLNTNDLVVVDIGAQSEHYCGDLSRTYPISGRFNKRQKEIYEIVLETQEYIANLVQPGFWLSNKENPEKSLNHLAKDFLKEKGYEKYFLHGIGHFLGLDVHDVGDYQEPLQIGDVITIEPGIYIKEENLGVRIEDNYWIIEDGVVCLSEQLPKKVDEIEKILKTFSSNK